MLEWAMLDGIRYGPGPVEIYWPIAEELCRCGVAKAPGYRTGLRNPERLAKIGIIIDRRKKYV